LKPALEVELANTVRFSEGVVRGLTRNDAFKSAAAVAFWLFLSLAPLLVFLGFLLGQVARRRGVDALLGPALEVIPAASEALVREELGRLAGRDAAPIAPVSVAGFLWTASSGVHNLMDLFEAMVRATKRAYWKKRCLALGWVVAGLLAACLLAVTLVRFDSALRVHGPEGLHSAPLSSATTRLNAASSSGHEQDARRAIPRARTVPLNGGALPQVSPPSGLATTVGQVFAATSMLLFGTVFLASFYRVAVVRPRRVRRRVWPGTIAAVACWLGVSWAFGAYAASMADYALFYGSLAAVAVLLVWLYLTSLSLIVGFEVNALLERSGAGVASKDRSAISPV
jgi:membrane protein